MTLNLTTVATLGFSTLVLSGAGTPPLTTDDLYKLRAVGDVQLSADASRVAYTIFNSDTPGRPHAQVWSADLETRQARFLADGSEPRWSPDGARLAYAERADDGHGSGLFVVESGERTGEAERVKLADWPGTNHPLPSAGERIAWSPDGKQVAFVAASVAAPLDPDPIVITRYLYKPPSSNGPDRFNDNRRLHIFLVDLATRRLRQLTDGPYYEHSIDWSPDGREILFVSNREEDPDRTFNYDIFSVGVVDGRVRRLTQTRSAEYEPRWSPNGRQVAFLGTTRPLTSSETTMEDTHVWVMEADGSGRRDAGAAIDNRQGAPRWVGGALAFAVQERGRSRLHVRGVPIDPGGSVGAWSIAGDTIAAAVTTGERPADLVTRRGRTGGWQPWNVTANDRLLRARALAEVESFTFKSFDGLEVEAFITRPVGLDPGRKYPLVALIHGGPHAQQGPAFNSKAQVYAGAGFASLMVNYRGSTGYGQKFADAIFGDQNGGEAKDVLGGVSAAIAKYPWIDRGALFVEGVSYGGQLTNWLVTQTGRFRAAVSTAGISNLVSFNYLAYYHDYLAVEFGSYPHEGGAIDKLWERSPIRYARDARTPVLFLHGEEDNDVPIAEAEQFYIALKDVGVDTVLVRYPREGHGLRETRHVVDAIERSLGWYQRHAKGNR